MWLVIAVVADSPAGGGTSEYLSGIGQSYVLLALTYPFARCIFGDLLALK